MTIGDIKQAIARRATEFKTGGFKPTHQPNESWIGRVYLYKADEEIPLTSDGDVMYPLLQLYVADLPGKPACLANTTLLTLFVGNDLPYGAGEEPMGNTWVLREYTANDQLEIKHWVHPYPLYRSFPLKPVTVEADYPVWDDPAMPADVADAVLALEKSGEISDYYDVIENYYHHKVGGYPAYSQPSEGFEEGFEFAFQVASDDKADFYLGENGTLLFAKNSTTGEWKVYVDGY